MPNPRTCKATGLSRNFVFYDPSSCSCNGVFTTSCEKGSLMNMFDTPEDCMKVCPEASDDGCNGGNAIDNMIDIPPTKPKNPPRRMNNQNRNLGYRN